MPTRKKRSKKKKPSPIKQEYNKQRKRLQNYLSKKRKKGYIFPENVIPPRPKRITKASVSRLAKITPKKLLSKGELNPCVTTYNPPRISDNILRSIEDILDRFPEPNDWKDWQYEIHAKHHAMLKRMFETQVYLNGRNVIALRFEKSSADVVQIVERLIYGDSDEETFQIDLAWFAQIIKGEALSDTEAEEIRALIDNYDE